MTVKKEQRVVEVKEEVLVTVCDRCGAKSTDTTNKFGMTYSQITFSIAQMGIDGAWAAVP